MREEENKSNEGSAKEFVDENATVQNETKSESMPVREDGGDVNGSVLSGHEEAGPMPTEQLSSDIPIQGNGVPDLGEEAVVIIPVPESLSIAPNPLSGADVERTKEEFLALHNLVETDLHVMAAIVHDILRVILGRFESFPLAGDFRLVHLNEAKVFLEYVTGAIEIIDGNAEEFYMGLCECYASNGYEMGFEYNPVNKKTIWGKPFTGLTAIQQLAFHSVFAFLAEYISVRFQQKKSAE